MLVAHYLSCMIFLFRMSFQFPRLEQYYFSHEGNFSDFYNMCLIKRGHVDYNSTFLGIIFDIMVEAIVLTSLQQFDMPAAEGQNTTRS